MNPIRSKIVAKLSDEGVDKLEAWLNAKSPVERRAIVSTMTDEEVDLVDMYKKSLDRDKEIASMEKAADKEAVESSPIQGRIKAYGEGVAATIPFAQELGTGIRSLGSDKSYYDQKKEDEQLRDALKEAYPGAFYGGAGVGVATQVLAPFGIAGKVIPKTGSLSLGKPGKVAQKIVAGPTSVFGKSKLGRTASVPLIGAGYGLMANPEGVSSTDEELKARFEGAKTGATISSALGFGIPAIAKTLEAGQAAAGKVIRGIPWDVSRRIQKNPELLSAAGEIEPRLILEDVLQKVNLRKQSVGKAIESSLKQAQKAGIKVNVESVTKMIDDDIAKIQLENAGQPLSDLSQERIDFLTQFKKDLLTPKNIEEWRMDVPAQVEEFSTSKVVNEAVDADQQPYARGKRIIDDLEKDFKVSLRGKLPKDVDMVYIERLGQLRGQQLKAAIKQWFNINVPEEKLADLQNVIEVAPVVTPVGQQIGYEAQTFTVPAGTEGAYKVEIPQEPFKDMSPLFSQAQKLAAKKKYRAFPVKGGTVNDVEGYLAELGQKQREAIPNLGLVSKDKLAREKSKLPFDVWANIRDKQVPTVSKKLIGLNSIPETPSEEQVVKLVKNLVENKAKVQDDIRLLIGSKNTSEILELAKNSYAQMLVGKEVNPYFRNRSLWTVANMLKAAITGGGLTAAGYGVPGLVAIGAGAGISSNLAYRTLPSVNKFMQKGARATPLAAYLSGKINNNEEQ